MDPSFESFKHCAEDRPRSIIFLRSLCSNIFVIIDFRFVDHGGHYLVSHNCTEEEEANL